MTTPTALARAATACTAAIALAIPADAQPPLPEPYAEVDGMQVTGVTVTEEGRVFLTFPRWREGVAFTLGELDTVTREPHPYPDARSNAWAVGDAPGEAFVNVQSAVAVGDTLYVADTRNPLIEGLLDQPRLHLYDLRTDSLVGSYVLDSAATVAATYLNDLRVDRRRGRAYFTDSGDGALVSLDLATGSSRRLLDDHPSVAAEVDSLVVDGEPWRRSIPSDGIALDVDGDRLLYHALSGYTLYAVSLAALADPDADLDAAVKRIARTPAPDGLWYLPGSDEVVMADLEEQAVVAVDATGTVRVLAAGEEVGWADTFSRHGDHLYFTNSRLPEAGDDVSEMTFPVYRIRVE